MKELIKVMKAVSDPSRIKIMKMLQQRVMCVCEIQTALAVAQSTASKHLKLLEDAGLIGSFRDGMWVNYALSDGLQSPYAASIIGSLKHWLEDDPEILFMRAQLPNIRREQITAR